jgi:hypothetical protein
LEVGSVVGKQWRGWGGVGWAAVVCVCGKDCTSGSSSPKRYGQGSKRKGQEDHGPRGRVTTETLLPLPAVEKV